MSLEINSQTIMYTHIGRVEITDIIDLWSDAIEMSRFKLNINNFLFNYFDAEINFDEKLVDKFCCFILSQKPFLKNKKVAVLVNNPVSTSFLN